MCIIINRGRNSFLLRDHIVTVINLMLFYVLLDAIIH